MGKGVDGVGLAAVGIGSVLIWAGMKGYSVLAVVQNLVTGKPIATNVTVTNPLTTATATVVADATAVSPGATPSGGDRLTQAFRHLNEVGDGN